MMYSYSDFIGGRENFARLHGRQALQSGRVSCGPTHAEEARLGDPGDGDGIRLVAAQHVEVGVVLTDGETHMAT